MGWNDEIDDTIYKVVINHEEQYSIWLADRENPLGWNDEGFSGTKQECLDHIEEVWTDMRPLSLRKKMEEMQKENEKSQNKIHTIIFEADTPIGKFFDIVLLAAILISVIIVMLDSVASLQQKYGQIFYTFEWIFTILFSIEYLLRLFSVGKPLKYAFSFFGIIDLLAIIPTYLSILIPGSQYFLIIRILRVLRIFRVLKFVQYIGEAKMLRQALNASRRKITVFIFTVIILVIIFGSMMYLIEGEKNGFTSIPQSIYWAIVTLTTVGYGDISPQTELGKTLAALIMILGYGIIAVPTGIVTSELTYQKKNVSTQACPDCSCDGHDIDANHCKYCGSKL